jgi:hypothetical protein
VNHHDRKLLAKSKRQIERRLQTRLTDTGRPVLGGRQPSRGRMSYELSDKVSAISFGGIGLMTQLVKQVGLAEAINARLHLLKVHQPYHESDHVLNLAYNALCDATCLDDLELRRNDRVFLDAIAAERIPDPTTAGDFLRRFDADDCLELMHAIDDARLKVWQRIATLSPKRRDDPFFEEAIIDADGTMVNTTGECKQGMEINYKGQWGYHPLLISLANTGEVLRLYNRPGNRPSHEHADAYLDEAIDLVQRGGFKKILLRGDTDFTQAFKLDEWNRVPNLRFVFGIDAMTHLCERAEQLEKSAWKPLLRHRNGSSVPTDRQRARPGNVKEAIVTERGFTNITLQAEQVAEFEHRPGKCQQAYRIIVVKKDLSISQGQPTLFEHDTRFFFYITNDRKSSVEQIVTLANGRCQQENLIEQLKHGVCALKAPVDAELSNWVYMICTALAWNLKAWWALWLPITARHPDHVATQKREREQVLRMEFKSFVNYFLQLPCQIIQTSRRIIYRILNYNPSLPIFLRNAAALRC